MFARYSGRFFMKRLEVAPLLIRQQLGLRESGFYVTVANRRRATDLKRFLIRLIFSGALRWVG
jgi:hypothetical protein